MTLPKRSHFNSSINDDDHIVTDRVNTVQNWMLNPNWAIHWNVPLEHSKVIPVVPSRHQNNVHNVIDVLDPNQAMHWNVPKEHFNVGSTVLPGHQINVHDYVEMLNLNRAVSRNVPKEHLNVDLMVPPRHKNNIHNVVTMLNPYQATHQNVLRECFDVNPMEASGYQSDVNNVTDLNVYRNTPLEHPEAHRYMPVRLGNDVHHSYISNVATILESCFNNDIETSIVNYAAEIYSGEGFHTENSLCSDVHCTTEDCIIAHPFNSELDQYGWAMYCNVPQERLNWLGEMPSTVEHAQQYVDEAQAISRKFYHELSKFTEMLDSTKTAWETHPVSHLTVQESNLSTSWASDQVTAHMGNMYDGEHHGLNSVQNRTVGDVKHQEPQLLALSCPNATRNLNVQNPHTQLLSRDKEPETVFSRPSPSVESLQHQFVLLYESNISITLPSESNWMNRVAAKRLEIHTNQCCMWNWGSIMDPHRILYHGNGTPHTHNDNSYPIGTSKISDSEFQNWRYRVSQVAQQPREPKWPLFKRMRIQIRNANLMVWTLRSPTWGYLIRWKKQCLKYT